MLSREEFEEFLKTSMPREYQQVKHEANVFKNMIQKPADKYGVKIVHKSELARYPDMYGVSLKEMMEGKDPIKNRERKN